MLCGFVGGDCLRLDIVRSLTVVAVCCSLLAAFAALDVVPLAFPTMMVSNFRPASRTTVEAMLIDDR